jgi:hypothetical protein
MARDIEDELDQLRQLRDTGALSDAEYRRAKAVIQGTAVPDSGKRGPRATTPGPEEPEPSWVSMTTRLIGGLIAVGIGIWLLLEGTVQQNVVGVILLFFGVFWPTFHGRNFWAFRRAFADYQHQRRQLVGDLKNLEAE